MSARARAFALGFGVLVSICGAEVALRLGGVEYPDFYQADPDTGAWHVPGVRGLQTKEGRALVSISSAGLRDHEHPVEKPADEIRIAVLGDSYAEAAQVGADDAFWAVLERELASCPALGARRVEALNFGVSGFGTAQELQVLRHKASAYAPDVVLVAFVLNDVRVNHPAIEGNPAIPYFSLVDGTLVLDDSFRESAPYREATSRSAALKSALRRRSRIVQLLYEMRDLRVRLARRAEVRGGLDAPVFAPPATREWREAWQLTEALLAQIALESRALGAEPLIAVLSDGLQVHPDPEVRRARARELGVEDLFYYEDRVLAFAARERIRAVGLSRLLRSEAERERECVHGFANALPCEGHWNELGHRIAGVQLASEVCALLAERAAAADPLSSPAGSGS